MAEQILFFGIDELYPYLMPHYNRALANGDIKVAAYAKIDGEKVSWFDATGTGGGTGNVVLDFAILSAEKNFYRQIKMLEKIGVPREKIIDGRAFRIPNLNVPYLFKEKVAYAEISGDRIIDNTHCIYPRVYQSDIQKFYLTMGIKSYVSNVKIEGVGIVEIGNFSSVSWDILFELRLNNFHNYKNVSSYAVEIWDDELPQNFINPLDNCKIEIGNDVWIGRGAILKSNNPEKPLKIGDGAVIASDSVVVKDVPPYAIVGGNPAKIIKYRFDEETVDALLKIQWWNWDLYKIYDNFKYFNRVEDFIAMHI